MKVETHFLEDIQERTSGEASPQWVEGHNILTASRISRPTLGETGDTYTATMPMTPFIAQHIGLIAGGALLLFAEATAGSASIMQLEDGWTAVGQCVNANHMIGKMVEEGNLTAYGRLLHRGRRSHVWHVEIKDDEGAIISAVTVTNAIIAME